MANENILFNLNLHSLPIVDYLNVSIYLEDEERMSFSSNISDDRMEERDQIWTSTYAELSIEHDHNNHVNEITEEHRCVNISNEQGLFQLPVEFNDRFHEVRVTRSTKEEQVR